MPHRPPEGRSLFRPDAEAATTDSDRKTAIAIARWMMCEPGEEAYGRHAAVDVELLTAAIAVVRAAIEEECGERAATLATVVVDSEWWGDFRACLSRVEGAAAREPAYAVVERAEALADVAARMRVKRKLRTTEGR